MAASTSLAFATKTTTSGACARISTAIDCSALPAVSCSTGAEPSCRPRVSRMRIAPPERSYVYQRPRPVCAVTCPSSATFAPRSELTSDDLPAPRRPTSTSAGGRFSSSTVRSVLMRARRSPATFSGSRSSSSSRRAMVRARDFRPSSSCPGMSPSM